MCIATVLGIPNLANANQTEGFEFHGYFRTGIMLSSENDFKRSNYAGQKETLGRLGLEADNDYNANLVSRWDFDDGRNFNIHFGVSKRGDESALTSSADSVEAGIGNAYFELNGITPSGTLWAGRREYGKEDNYIFMTDFFYHDMSGTGLGIQGYELGDSLVDLAYIVSDRVDEDIDRWETDPAEIGNNATNLNNLLHVVNISSTFGNLKLSGLLKAMPDNWDRAGNEWAEMGFDLTATYNLSSFFSIPGNGFSNIIIQAGKGLGAGNLLGGTITDYNAYHPGSLAQGQHSDWGADGQASYLLTQLEEDDTSARAMLWGGYFFENGVSLFPSIQAQYNDMAEGDARTDGGYNYWVSAMVRPTMPISQHFYLQGEVGYVYNNWNGGSWTQNKATISPTVILPTSLGVAPEIRMFATYLSDSWTNIVDGETESDLIVGIQAEVWW
ncbi:carbohydrate porin [Vibrio sp. ES.051]|uniref:carbohydrate porin n=1 Tax=Vibrio sp. ES.051 TaxID=1761909 RepID=UPI00211D346E|nr:carbohydrate porin [Vibrio sp. ES.051]